MWDPSRLAINHNPSVDLHLIALEYGESLNQSSRTRLTADQLLRLCSHHEPARRDATATELLFTTPDRASSTRALIVPHDADLECRT